MNILIQRIFTTVILGVFSASTLADRNTHYHYATVTEVTPIVKTISYQEPHKECWIETVRHETYSEPEHQHSSQAASTVVGSLVGAAIGHGVGNGRKNKQIGAVAGAILGGAIGHDISRNHNRSHHHTQKHVEYRDEERCSVSHSTQYEERVVGYDVSYRYNGSIYHTEMDHHPGDRIKIAVDVRPIQ